MIRIDGSQGEGGGQVLRTSLALSVLTGQPFHLTRIRANRRNPGLAPQHLAGVRAAAQLAAAEVSGDELRSSELIFQPRAKASPGDYYFDVSQLAGQGSAGAITLLLQAVLLPLALADGPSTLVLRGGTHVAWSPPYHYVEWVLFPVLRQIGLDADAELAQSGWYPQGGGELRVSVAGNADLHGITLLERGPLTRLHGVAVAANLPSHIPQRMADRANNLLRDAALPPVVQPGHLRGPSTGAAVLLAAEYGSGVRAGFSALGERGKPSEVVAGEAVGELLAYRAQPGALDEHLPDQILTALMLADGPSALSTVEITRHTLTNIRITQRFVERSVHVEGSEGEPGVITVDG